MQQVMLQSMNLQQILIQKQQNIYQSNIYLSMDIQANQKDSKRPFYTQMQLMEIEIHYGTQILQYLLQDKGLMLLLN